MIYLSDHHAGQQFEGEPAARAPDIEVTTIAGQAQA
jgi:hypothetical protein